MKYIIIIALLASPVSVFAHTNPAPIYTPFVCNFTKYNVDKKGVCTITGHVAGHEHSDQKASICVKKCKGAIK